MEGAMLGKMVAHMGIAAAGTLIMAMSQNRRGNWTPRSNPTSRSSSRPTQGSSTRSSEGAGGLASGADDEPPEEDRNRRNNPRPQCLSDPESPLNALLRLLSAASLEDATMGRPAINLLYEIDDGNVKYLDKLVDDLSRSGYFDLVVKVVQLMFDVMYVDDISFLNLYSLLNFVAVFVGKYIDHKLKIENKDGSNEVRKKDVMDGIWDEIDAFTRRCLKLFNWIQREVHPENQRLAIQYRDVFSAVYHYYEHMTIYDGRVLSVAEYFKLISEHMELVMELDAYDELVRLERELNEEQDQPTRRGNQIRGLFFVVYDERYKRRFRIVLKIQDGRLVLASAFFVSKEFKGDKKGKTFFRRLFE